MTTITHAPKMGKVMMKARATVVLDHPFFASILLRHPMLADTTIPTAAMNGQGRMRYNPEFIEGLTNKQAVWVLCHEVLHYVGMDAFRVGHRDPKAWNYAADAWINDTLNTLGIGEPVPQTVNMPGSAQKTRENIYDEMPKDDKGGGGGQGNDPMAGDVEASDGSATEHAEQEANIKVELAEAAQAAKMRGKLPGILQKMVADTIDSKVPWYDILERHMTERVRNDYSWSRPNRRYMPAFYLPTLDGVGSMGELAIQVDISGSVSREEIQYYNGHMKRIVELCKPSKVHVIYTDTEVQHHDEYDNPEEVEITFHSGGGTDMVAGLHYLEDKGIEPVVLVTLTDGFTPFPATGEFAVPQVWCISSDKESPTGDTVHFDMNH